MYILPTGWHEVHRQLEINNRRCWGCCQTRPIVSFYPSDGAARVVMVINHIRCFLFRCPLVVKSLHWAVPTDLTLSLRGNIHWLFYRSKLHRNERLMRLKNRNQTLVKGASRSRHDQNLWLSTSREVLFDGAKGDETLYVIKLLIQARWLTPPG